MNPGCIHLQGLSRDINESFKGYPQRWRELAAHVQPPLLEKEMVDLFMDILSGSYFGRMICNASLGFSGLVKVGERIESGPKSGRIQGPLSSQSIKSEYLVSSQEENEEVNAIWETHQAP